MKYTGITYRPPFEAQSLLLQVTSGCSHNSCSFCTMYRDVPFGIEDIEHIKADILEASLIAPNTRRVFLENGDPFVLPAKTLLTIADEIHEKLPHVETIAMYASIPNIKIKSDADLAALRQAGLNELNIGVESGLDEALAYMNKGYTAAEAEHELGRLLDAGFDYGANIILGGAGSEKRIDNAIASAELLNKVPPYLIFTGTIHADPGCPHWDALESGTFGESTVEEYLQEEEAFLEYLNLPHSYYFGLHPSNIVKLAGWIPEDKDALLAELREQHAELTASQLSRPPLRYGEGGVII